MLESGNEIGREFRELMLHVAEAYRCLGQGSSLIVS